MSPTTARKRRKTSRRPKRMPNLMDADRANVIVAGAGRIVQGLRTAIRKSGIACRHTTKLDVALELADARTQAMVLVPPLSGASVLDFCGRLDPARQPLPMLVALPGIPNDKTLRRLYQAGVTGVFCWPDERRALLQTLLRLVEIHAEALDEHRTATDVALEEQAKLALERAEMDFGAPFNVVVVQRSALLIGRVDSLWKLYAAKHAVEDLPGIQQVDTKGVAVDIPRRPDRAVARTVRKLIEVTSDVDASTIAVSVDSGCVTLSGSAENRRELKRLEHLVSHVRGVCSVERLIVVSSQAKLRDQTVAKQIRKRLAARGCDDTVRAAVFGGVCVLTGSVPSARRRRELEELAREQPGVDRVVDKLEVRAKS